MQIRMHWSLIIVCMPTKEADSGPIMLHLDSLGIHSSQKLFDIVRRYVHHQCYNAKSLVLSPVSLQLS